MLQRVNQLWSHKGIFKVAMLVLLMTRIKKNKKSVTFSKMTTVPNFMKIRKVLQKLVGKSQGQTDSL